MNWFENTWCATDPSGVAALVLVAASWARPRSWDIFAGEILTKIEFNLGHEGCSKPSTVIVAGGNIVENTRAGVVGVNTPAPW